MTVRLTSAVLGQAVGSSYTGALESWLLNEGYATTAATVPDAWAEDSDGVLGGAKPSVTVTPTAAVLVGANDAVNLTATGSVVFGTKGGVRTTVALVTADTPAAAATKIDTALAGKADAAIVSGNLTITSNATGPEAYVTVEDGNATVLANLSLVVGQAAHGGDGRPTGASNTGAQADLPANDPQDAAKREAPYFPTTPDLNATIANDADNLNEDTFPLARFDFDASGTDTEAPSSITLDPVEGPEEGGTLVRIFGDNLEGITAVKFDTVSGTALDVSEAGDGIISVVTPAGTAGPADVLLDDGSTDTTLTGGFTYLATP